MLFHTCKKIDKDAHLTYNNGDRSETDMQIIQIVVVIVLGIVIGQLISNRMSKRKTRKYIHHLPYDEFKKNMRKGALIDIRKQDAFEKDKIKGARNYRIPFLKNKKQNQVRRDKPLYLYCQNGHKSTKAAQKLVYRFNEIYVLEGGFNAYKKAKDESIKN